MNWKTPGGDSTKNSITGDFIAGTPGIDKSVSCRFHSGGTKEYVNEDNTVVKQKGRIRVDAGVEIPEKGQTVEVVGQFTGIIRDIYKGQLSWRLDV